MNNPGVLKRPMLTNPNTGRHGGHPRPQPSQTGQHSSTSSNSHADKKLQPQLDQAADQMKNARPHADPQTKPPSVRKEDDAPPKPKEPVILPPKPEKTTKQTHFTPDISENIVSRLAEVPQSHLQTREEIEQIKKLKAFKPVAIGTGLFILGLVVSAILAIFFNLI